MFALFRHIQLAVTSALIRGGCLDSLALVLPVGTNSHCFLQSLRGEVVFLDVAVVRRIGDDPDFAGLSSTASCMCPWPWSANWWLEIRASRLEANPEFRQLGLSLRPFLLSARLFLSPQACHPSRSRISLKLVLGPIKMRQFIFTHTSGPVPRHAVLGVGGVQ